MPNATYANHFGTVQDKVVNEMDDLYSFMGTANTTIDLRVGKESIVDDDDEDDESAADDGSDADDAEAKKAAAEEQVSITCFIFSTTTYLSTGPQCCAARSSVAGTEQFNSYASLLPRQVSQGRYTASLYSVATQRRYTARCLARADSVLAYRRGATCTRSWA